MDRRVLFITPHLDDIGTVSRMLESADIDCEHVSSCQEARSRLTREPFGAILTEAYLPDGDWKRVLNFTFELGISPAVIVTHRVADDRFWAEVLNLGCYDMLAQPFDAREVQRIVTLACSQVRRKPVVSGAAPGKTLSAAM